MKRKIFITVLICIFILATHTIWLPIPAKILLVKDNIKKADCIVDLSGDWEFSRERRAIQLYKEGFANKIIRILEAKNKMYNTVSILLNLNLSQKDYYKKYFEHLGVPEDALIFGDEVATSTFDEFKTIRDVILKNDFKSVIVVTSDYHMRRALMTAKWIFGSKGIKIYNAAVYSEYFNPDRWWLNEDDIKGVVIEYLSIAFYLTYHFALGK